MMFSGTDETERERLEIEGERLARYEKQAQAEFISVCAMPDTSEASMYQAWLVWSRLCDRCLEIERLISILEQRPKVPAVTRTGNVNSKRPAE
jgi:hypothetical protein